MSTPKLSIVTTLYRSAATIEEFILRAELTGRSLFVDEFEIVVVDDGSPDDSLARVRRLAKDHPHLVIVELSRNFGHHVALLEGLRVSRGEIVYLIDSDLEEHPEWASRFIDELRHSQSDVVYGYQVKRKGQLFERLSGSLYWSIFRRLSGLDIPPNIVTCRIMTRQYVDAIASYVEREVSIGAIFSVAGFRQRGIPVEKGDRGSSTYSLVLKLWHFVNSISSFSTKPLSAIFLLGAVTSVVGFALVVYLIAAALLWSRSPAGWASVMASVWLIGGLVLIGMGVIAVYIGKIFVEVKNRPRAIVRSIERSDGN